MEASLKPGYLKLNIAATAVGKEERKMLLITTCWMKASNALDDGHLMPSNPLFKRHWRFVLNLNLKFQKGAARNPQSHYTRPCRRRSASWSTRSGGSELRNTNDNLSPRSIHEQINTIFVHFHFGREASQAKQPPAVWISSKCNADQLGFSSQERLFLDLSTASLTSPSLGQDHVKTSSVSRSDLIKKLQLYLNILGAS